MKKRNKGLLLFTVFLLTIFLGYLTYASLENSSYHHFPEGYYQDGTVNL
jgi:hypothetical protein